MEFVPTRSDEIGAVVVTVGKEIRAFGRWQFFRTLAICVTVMAGISVVAWTIHEHGKRRHAVEMISLLKEGSRANVF